MLTMISNRLYQKYKITIDVLTLQSMFEEGLPDHIIDKIEECREYFKDMDEYITIIDNVSNPTGVHKTIKNYSINHGTHYFYNFLTDKEKKNCQGVKTLEEYNDYIKKEGWAYSHYEPFDPATYVLVVVDHFSLLQPEKNAETVHQAMTLMSAEYGRKQITKHFKYVFINVQQQAAAGEQAEYTKMGEKIEDKFKPSLANLADNKLTARDCHLVLGLYSPERHGIKDYKGYDIGQLGDKFRSLIVLKNRIGSGYIEDALYFNGAINVFKELPYPKEMNQEIYKQIKTS